MCLTKRNLSFFFLVVSLWLTKTKMTHFLLVECLYIYSYETSRQAKNCWFVRTNYDVNVLCQIAARRKRGSTKFARHDGKSGGYKSISVIVFVSVAFFLLSNNHHVSCCRHHNHTHTSAISARPFLLPSKAGVWAVLLRLVEHGYVHDTEGGRGELSLGRDPQLRRATRNLRRTLPLNETGPEENSIWHRHPPRRQVPRSRKMQVCSLSESPFARV